MSGLHGLALCALVALSPALLASDDHTPAGRSSVDPETVSGSHAAFTWADYDGDGSLDLAAVNEQGKLQLLQNVGEGRFEDVTESVGLSGIENAALTLWADYDGDGWLDLFVGAREGASRLLHNDVASGGLFSEVSQASGLRIEGLVQSAHWLDHDGDGRLDLHVIAAEKNLLFRGLDDGGIEGGLFEGTELPLSGETLRFPPFGDSSEKAPEHKDPVNSPRDRNDAGGIGSDRTDRDGGRVPSGKQDDIPLAGPSRDTPSGPAPLNCASSIRDQAMPASCIQASSTPTLGLLYPISANLFVAVSGNVGIGTTSPAATLHVAGTARVADTLTLAPGGDMALNVSTGSIYKSGVLFLHNKGNNNTAVGWTALSSVTTGEANTATGYRALFNNTAGNLNTASGSEALRHNTTGFSNTASGSAALFWNTTGWWNTAHGASALASNTEGSFNTASGAHALQDNTTGSRNTASGNLALLRNTTGSDNTATGYRALGFNTTGTHNTATGSRALHDNTTASDNTASGFEALRFNTGSHNTATGSAALKYNTAYHNTAIGSGALYANTTGLDNAALGSGTLSSNMTGNSNTAMGRAALISNTTGSFNTATGRAALYFNTYGGGNTAAGHNALRNNTTGSGNIAVGAGAGSDLTTGNNNIDIGHPGFVGESATIRIGTSSQSRAFIAGIHGQTSSGGIAVLVNGSGQLGTTTSSRRFKEDIADMGDATERLLELRPVVFRYKPDVQEGERPREYGLIAEEVAEIFPDLVVYDEAGEPFTVKYHILSSMLLNELKKQVSELEQLRERDEDRAQDMEDLRERFAKLEARIAEASLLGQPR